MLKKRPQSNSPDNLTMESHSGAGTSSPAHHKSILPLHKQHRQSSSTSGSRSPSDSPPSRRTQRYNSGGSHNSHNSFYNDTDTATLPTWSANPQSPGDDTATATDYPFSPLSPNPNTNGQESRYFSNQQYNRRSRWIPSCQTIVFAVAFLAGMVTVLQSRGSLIYSLEEVAQLVHNSNVLRTKLTNAEKGIKLLQREVTAYDVMLQQQEPKQPDTATAPQPLINNNPSNQALQEMQQLSERLQDSQKRADSLKQRVQKLAKTEAKAQYGDHTHRVELELVFPDGRDGPTKFVIELAPLELMPHSVHFFLELASSQLLDGCSFILNALHVLKAAPLPYDGSSAANKARAFTRMGLESVAFKEYAPSYPHEQYTVGFAADGSPSFYINTEDNSEIHLGDPCFGKIVEGFDTVKRLEASPTRNGIWFEQRIGIKKATVLM